MEVVRTVQSRSAVRNTSGHHTQKQNWTEPPNTRRRTWFVCLLCVFCVVLVIALILLYMHLTAERDRMKTTYMNKVEKCNKALNSLKEDYSRLNDYKDSLIQIKLELETNYTYLIDERDQLQKNFDSVIQKRLELENELKKRKHQKDSYFRSSEYKSWSDSRRFCRDRGGDLIIINTEEEQRYVHSIIEENTWIGLSDIEKEGVMKWVDNSTPNVTFWISGEPNNAYGNENCVQTVSSYPPKQSWNDQPCTEKRQWICEN